MIHPQQPLAPWSNHRFSPNMALSIIHRVTGIALTLILWWGVLVWSSLLPNPIAHIMNSIWIRIGIGGVIWILSYHTMNGIRHFIWDKGQLMEPHTLLISGIAVSVLSVMTAWLVFFYGFKL